MSDAERGPTHRPQPDAKLDFIAYSLGLQFHPPLKLTRQAGWIFAPKLASYVDARGAKVEDTEWQFSQPNGEFRITIRDTTIVLDAKNPVSPLEWFETRSPLILAAFQETFSPKLLLTSTAMAAATLPIDGDSRTFLASHVMKMDTRRLAPLARPIQLVGLRFTLPAFEIKARPPGKRKKVKSVASAEWAAQVRVESLASDPSKLFLEVGGQWPIGKQWDAAAMTLAVESLDTVKTFLKTNLLPFLTTELEQSGE